MPQDPPRGFPETSTNGSTHYEKDTEDRKRRGQRPLFVALGVGLAGAVLAAGVILLVGSYTFLPEAVGERFERDLHRQLGLDERPEVELESDPPPSILLGRFEEGSITLGGAGFGEVRPERVEIDLEPFKLDVLGSLSSEGLESREPLSGELEAVVSEGEVTRLAEERLEEPPITGVSLENGRLLVELDAEVLGIRVPISVRGGLRVEEENLVFEPQRVRAFGESISGDLSERLVSRAEFRYPLDELPYGASISEAEIQNERLILRGEIERIPLGSTGS